MRSTRTSQKHRHLWLPDRRGGLLRGASLTALLLAFTRRHLGELPARGRVVRADASAKAGGLGARKATGTIRRGQGEILGRLPIQGVDRFLTDPTCQTDDADRLASREEMGQQYATPANMTPKPISRLATSRARGR